MTATQPACDICGRSTGPLYAFRATKPDGKPNVRCLRHALFYGPVFRQAIWVAAVVGTILFLINQADVVFSGHTTLLVVAKVALTYIVPFCVSTYSALEVNRLRSG